MQEHALIALSTHITAIQQHVGTAGERQTPALDIGGPRLQGGGIQHHRTEHQRIGLAVADEVQFAQITVLRQHRSNGRHRVVGRWQHTHLCVGVAGLQPFAQVGQFGAQHDQAAVAAGLAFGITIVTQAAVFVAAHGGGVQHIRRVVHHPFARLVLLLAAVKRLINAANGRAIKHHPLFQRKQLTLAALQFAALARWGLSSL